jgi:DNA-binding transcriptional ArsR family regulator
MTTATKNSRPLNKQQDVCTVPCFDHTKVNALRANLARDEKHLPELADFYKLLANTTRLKILFSLAETELCVCDIAHVLGLSIAATSHQLKLLRSGGWLSKRDDGKMVYYRLQSAVLLEALKGDLGLMAGRLK